jgi:adenylate cyclase class IV
MKISVKVNLGNYQTIAIETNDYPTLEACIKEIDEVLSKFKTRSTEQFRKNYLMPVLRRLNKV